jgi:hypothetical protein
MSALDHDPLRVVWGALERGACDPHGKPHDFRSRCPAHDGGNPHALHVKVGADGRALLWCFVGCDAENVVAALGLAWPDLFPPGHRHARPIPGVGRPVPFVELMLGALIELGIPYRATRDAGLWVADLCPVCRRSDRWPLLIEEDDRGRVTLACAGGCDQIDVVRAIVGAEEP